MLLRAVFLLAFFSIVSGCATRPVSNLEATFVPNNRVINSQYLERTNNSGVVTIKRDRGVGGSACSSRIFVNAQPIADLRTAEKIVIYLAEGEYVFSAWPNGICGGGMSEVNAQVKSGVELNFRVGYGSNGDFTINATKF